MLNKQNENFKDNNKISKVKSRLKYSISISILFGLLLIFYLVVSINDERFSNITKYFKLFLASVGFVSTTIAFYTQKVYYKLIFKERDM